MNDTSRIALTLLAAAAGCAAPAEPGLTTSRSSLEAVPNPAGIGEAAHVTGVIDHTNPFFLELGINGRTCATCHDPRSGYGISATLAQTLFEASGGLDPLFRIHDAGNRPDADISTVEARRAAFSTTTSKGLIRGVVRVPSTAEFEVLDVDDPYGWSTTAAFSRFRRPNPIVPEGLISSTTWTGVGDVRPTLISVMNGGSKSHAQRPTDVPLDQCVAGADFLMGLTFAQSVDNVAGRLDIDGANGGPEYMQTLTLVPGINDPAVTGDFKPVSFDLYEAWEDADRGDHSDQAKKRALIAKGEEIFYTKPIEITGVQGLNDVFGMSVIHGACSTCHNNQNVGNHSTRRLLDIGVADGSLRTSDIPLITLRNKATGEVRQTTDLGRAQSTGLWADLQKVKVPQLRGLASRAPYFHNGSAATVRDVLHFYKHRFHLDVDGDEMDALEAFLLAL
jgi:hypothetical protein